MATIPRKVQIAFALTILALIVAVPFSYFLARDKKYRRFRVVEEGVLYRSGMLTPEGLARVLDTRKIKTVVNLRDGSSQPDQAEADQCWNRGVKFVRITQRPWSAPDGASVRDTPAEVGLKEFFDVMNDPANYPVLVHCFAGHHRTGAYCAAFRMAYQGWTQEEAIYEMKHLGYDRIFEEGDVCGYLQHFHINQSPMALRREQSPSTPTSASSER